MVLLGAEAGEWTVSVKTADGNTVKYDVTVKSVANAYDINNPGKAPGQSRVPARSTGTAAPVVAKIDPGTGPVASASFGRPVSSSYTTTTDTVAPPRPAHLRRLRGIQSTATPPAPVSHSSFDFGPSNPAASYAPPPQSSQSASAALSNERYRVDPSVSLTGGELHSGAVSGGRHYLPEDGVQLQTGSSRIIDFATKLRRVSIADTTVADIQVINPFQVNLIGHKPGFTTLAVWDQRAVRGAPGANRSQRQAAGVAQHDGG